MGGVKFPTQAAIPVGQQSIRTCLVIEPIYRETSIYLSLHQQVYRLLCIHFLAYYFIPNNKLGGKQKEPFRVVLVVWPIYDANGAFVVKTDPSFQPPKGKSVFKLAV